MATNISPDPFKDFQGILDMEDEWWGESPMMVEYNKFTTCGLRLPGPQMCSTHEVKTQEV